MLTIKKKKGGNLQIKAKDPIDTVGIVKAVDPIDAVAIPKAKSSINAIDLPKAKSAEGLLGLSANLSALKKGKDVSAKTEPMKGAFPGVKAPMDNEQISAKDPGHTQAYKERIKKRAK